MGLLSWSNAYGVGYINTDYSSSTSATGSTFTITSTVSGTCATDLSGSSDDNTSRYYSGIQFGLNYGSTNVTQTFTSPISTRWSSGNNDWPSFSGTGSSGALNTATYFNTNNKSTRTITFTVYSTGIAAGYSGIGTQTFVGSAQTAGYATVTLNVPPTCNTPTISYNTNYIYAGLTTATVNVSGATAYYGGDIYSIKLTIGNQTATRTTNGNLSIALNAVGTFTPTIVITDSRGQTTTKTLSAIQVKQYVKPQVQFSVQRTASDGSIDPTDESNYTHATITAKFTYTTDTGNLSQPTLNVDGVNGAVSTTWYQTRTNGVLSNAITDWTIIANGATIYGIASNFSTDNSYVFRLTPVDTIGNGDVKIQVLEPVFYTIDFRAGGHGIAFGTPATGDGFKVAMSTTFTDDVKLILDDYTTGGVDANLKTAISNKAVGTNGALSGDTIDLKILLTNIINKL